MFHTFAALPPSCAAATKVLSILREESLVERTRKVGADLKEQLIDKFNQHPLVAEVRGEGLLIGIEIVKDRATLTPFDAGDGITNKIVGYGMQEGVFFYPGGTGEVRDIVCIGAPLIIGDEEVHLMVKALDTALGKVLAATAN